MSTEKENLRICVRVRWVDMCASERREGGQRERVGHRRAPRRRRALESPFLLTESDEANEGEGPAVPPLKLSKFQLQYDIPAYTGVDEVPGCA